MLHGKTTIDLYNVKTHRSERIVHKNMLTNWIKDSFVLPSINLSRPYYGLTREDFFGGLMMFAQALSNDADDYWFPNPTNRMTAHADMSTYSGSDLSRGSFNSSISTSEPGTITNVWDFVQEQGNGTIASLGLCMPDFAKIGSGQETPAEATEVGRVAGLPRQAMINSNVTGHHIFDGTNNKIYVYSVSSGVVTITEKIGAGYGNYNPVRGRIVFITSQTYVNEASLDSNGTTTRTVDLSGVLGSVSKVGIATDDGTHIYLIALNSNWASGARTLVRLNLADGTYTTQQVTNSTGSTIAQASSDLIGTIAVYNGYFYASTTGNKVVYIKLTDNSDHGTVKLPNGTEIQSTGTVTNLTPFSIIGNALCFFTATTFSAVAAIYTSDCFTIYGGAALYINISNFNTASSSSYGIFQNINKAWGEAECQNRSVNIYSGMIPSLSTKNNLEAAVTKTADMTMRVTYTVTDQAE